MGVEETESEDRKRCQGNRQVSSRISREYVEERNYYHCLLYVHVHVPAGQRVPRRLAVVGTWLILSTTDERPQ